MRTPVREAFSYGIAGILQNFHDGMTSAEEMEIQKQLSQGDSITEQNVAGWWTNDLS